MTSTEQILTIVAVGVATMLTRCIPFLCFPNAEHIPKFIKYLSTVLPYAMIGFLSIYSVKDAPFNVYVGVPEWIAILFMAAIHYWRRNMMFTMIGGTLLYMALVQTVFPPII